ncbi:metallophosphoesterase [Hyphomicrobium sp. D-2]|uniref:metallophosphoesterase n=1 Tax=Hyphomicrobium sp. D-2 TaxID=3041621 RepID=UPI0024583D30|nr:metallophosphoesterase [Hyphomicrobium sp. D-2]MDH4981940.1 metallophosphoesterase [Hyphomicrobium sp. D-2]
MKPLVDPRCGDIEDDASSTKSNSLLMMAGNMLGEISFAKLLVAWLALFIVPAVIIGVTPLIASAWLAKLAGKLTPALGIVPLAILAIIIMLGWLFGRRLLRLAESSFWSLNALVIEPVYIVCREVMRHIAEKLLSDDASPRNRERIRAWAAAASGLVISLAALAVFLAVWPSTQWVGQLSDLAAPLHLVWAAIANTVAVTCAYLAVAAFAWGIADATMPPPRDLQRFADAGNGGRAWRIAHLSDIHTVGEPYGFRIECGRGGPQGDDRFRRLLTQLETIHADNPLDCVLITGDATDAGRSAEWAEFLDALAEHPVLAERTLVLPGNHDINIVDRSNPARLDLSIGPNSRLRKIRTLSAMDAVQGQRVHTVDRKQETADRTLAATLAPHADEIKAFADTGRPVFSTLASDLWADVFPMVLPPETPNGLGVILLNSNADAHFSFTNALGLISVEQFTAMEQVLAQHPDAGWLIALHHHPIEYPRKAKVLAERIGTTLINGNWFLRRLQPYADRIILMHGHRHIDWIGECGGIKIVSAPSPVMESRNDGTTYFYIHSLTIDNTGRLQLLTPQRVDVAGDRDSTTITPRLESVQHS